MRLAALGFGLCFVLGFLLLFGSAHFQTLIFIGIRFRLAVYFGVPEPLVDNTVAFFHLSASSHIDRGIRVEVSPE
jgi:uncharacterized membrane protein YgaE (UPF0421/DUF939 family)